MSHQFHIITLFPEIFDSFLNASLVGKAREAGLIAVDCVDPRQFTTDRHRTVDDTPFGGGDGMVLKPGPLVAAMDSVEGEPHRVMLSPQGRPMTQQDLAELARKQHLLLVCGRYEGFDERIRHHVDQELSLGDFVLCGGEVPAMALLEGVARLIPGVIGNETSACNESHQAGLLEYPQYTRPREFEQQQVPEVLLGGNHQEIARWRQTQMLQRTRDRRPDLWQRYNLTDEDRELLGQPRRSLAQRTYLALLHHPVLDRTGKVVTTAVTNLDLHDIARSCCTYGLARYFVVTPLSSQQQLVARITEHWRTGHGARANPRRARALRLIQVKATLEQAIEEIEQHEGCAPLVVVTSAVARPGQVTRAEVQRQASGRPLLLLLGTGWGLTEEGLAAAELALAPLRGQPRYNHLSVRSAASILLDRFFGMRH